MKIKIRVRLSSEKVNEACRLGLDLSQIVDQALIRHIEAECLRRLEDRAGGSEGCDGTGSSTIRHSSARARSRRG